MMVQNAIKYILLQLTVELTEDNTFEFNTIKLNNAKALDEVMYNRKRQVFEAFMVDDTAHIEIIQELFTNGLEVIPASNTKSLEIKILTLLLTYYIGFKHIDYLIHHIPEQSKIRAQKSKSSRCNKNK